jgi:ribose/xylose/arabinose/galactoside ABC-type transport system permease subunit
VKGGLKSRATASIETMPPSGWVLIALVVAAALGVPRFLSAGNFLNVVRVASILALAAYGQGVVIVAGGLDFSSGSAVALTSVITVLALVSAGMTGPGALACGAAAAILIGALNGFLITSFNMPPFLVTLGMLIGVHGLASLLVGGIPLDAPPTAGFGWLAQGELLTIPVPVFFAAMGFVALALLTRTPLGRSWYLVGANPRAADFVGINRRRSVRFAYLVNGIFVAFAGIVLTARVGSGQPNLFPTLPFEAIAACAIGGLALSGGTGRPVQILLGVLIISVLDNAAVLLNFASSVQLMLIGALTIGAVLVQQIRWTRVRRRLRHDGSRSG